MRVIDRLLDIMEKKGITAYKVAQDTGIKQSSFSNWKKGVEPPASKIEILFKYLEVTPNEIYGYDQTQNLLNEPQKEMISIMEDMEEREQWKAVGIIENYSQNIKSEVENESDESSISKIS
jgi:transcriptional regulator with XRE-family HTH domain